MRFSLMQPAEAEIEYRSLPDSVMHDLGLDSICACVTADAKEQKLILRTLSQMTADPRAAAYRQKVFADILRLPDFRERMTALFDRIGFIRDFDSNHRSRDEAIGLWHLMHRLDELDQYIQCIEEMRDCLAGTDLQSEGLKAFAEYVESLWQDAAFDAMKQDIAALKQQTADIKSVTLGINVNERFEAISMGLISINNKYFKKSGIVRNFANAITAGNGIQDGTDWNGDMHYHPLVRENAGEVAAFLEKQASFGSIGMSAHADAATRATIVSTAEGDSSRGTTFYLEGVINKMLDAIVRRLRETLTKYANIAIVDLSRLLPEFLYYIRFAEFIEARRAEGLTFCEAEVLPQDAACSMEAADFYNLRLAVNKTDPAEIVCNDLVFDPQHTVYILTGANRGGKTTVTQAIGQLFVLAQGGIFVPAAKFAYAPADCICTHFPADEEKTMDLGRLGEECVRFREMYAGCTASSLMLLNETFSTTSFEEGFYIARDSVRALLKKRVRTVYNTHMHKLAAEAPAMTAEAEGAGAASLTVQSENGARSFKIAVAPPEGMSYARDIAEKYGVTYEMLVSGS
ncbi:MAG: DNA mismatch repair protein [Oscillospiraceae bacterium]|nr:DNA mismatch repair protein [Oscillospiraceae bacterium]